MIQRSERECENGGKNYAYLVPNTLTKKNEEAFG